MGVFKLDLLQHLTAAFESQRTKRQQESKWIWTWNSEIEA